MLILLASDHLAPWALLRLALGVEILPPVVRDPGGKPRFEGACPPHFSLSHSGGLALCGVSDHPLGVDLERVRPRRPVLARRALSARELRWYQDRGERWADFYTLWTLKEARAKWSGRGLDRHPRAIPAPLLEPGQTAREGELVCSAYGGQGWRAALCGGETAGLTWI